VYHGSVLTALRGSYIYGDYGSGRIWALSTNGSAENILLVDSGLPLSSFGADQAGELYICAFDGKIHQLTVVAIPEFTTWGLILVFVAGSFVLAVAVRKRRFSSWFFVRHNP
jgi:hypothetical protein